VAWPGAVALPSEKKSGPDSGPSMSFPHPALPRPRRPWVLLAPAPPLPPCRSIGQEQPQQRWALAAVAARAAFKMTAAVEPNIPKSQRSTPTGEGRPSHASDVLLLGTGVQSEHRELEHGERGDRASALGRLRFFLRFIECDFAAALRSRHTHTCALRLTAPPCERHLGCMDRDDGAHGKRTAECDGRRRGWGLGEPTHI
jgi:hypothetical protein